MKTTVKTSTYLFRYKCGHFWNYVVPGKLSNAEYKQEVKTAQLEVCPRCRAKQEAEK